MTRIRVLPALACWLLLSPAWGQQEGYQPLSALPPVQGVDRPGYDHLYGRVRHLAEQLPGLHGAQVPTTGELHLGVILVEFPDQPRPSFSDPQNWERAFFSEHYTRTATGQAAYGSLAAYYRENSGGKLKVTGKVFDWVMAPSPRSSLERWIAYLPGANQALPVPVLKSLLKREGPQALDGLDVLVFVCAGGWAGMRGSLLWPHASLLRFGGRVYNHYVMSSGTTYFEPIGVYCHEMGHTLGILDKYGVGDDTGLGQWCSMAEGADGGRDRGVTLDAPTEDAEQTARRMLKEQVRAGLRWLDKLLGRPQPKASPKAEPKPRTQLRRPTAGAARPLHFCAVCKVRLGWSTPTVVDPRHSTRLYLTPIEQDPDQVVRVILDPHGRESLYLEYRAREGFDTDLPRSGLLVWRVGSPSAALRTFVPFERCELIAAHGEQSTDAPLRDPEQVPFPTPATDHAQVSGTLEGSWTACLRGIHEDHGRLYLEIGPTPE